MSRHLTGEPPITSFFPRIRGSAGRKENPRSQLGSGSSSGKRKASLNDPEGKDTSPPKRSRTKVNQKTSSISSFFQTSIPKDASSYTKKHSASNFSIPAAKQATTTPDSYSKGKDKAVVQSTPPSRTDTRRQCTTLPSPSIPSSKAIPKQAHIPMSHPLMRRHSLHVGPSSSQYNCNSPHATTSCEVSTEVVPVNILDYIPSSQTQNMHQAHPVPLSPEDAEVLNGLCIHSSQSQQTRFETHATLQRSPLQSNEDQTDSHSRPKCIPSSQSQEYDFNVSRHASLGFFRDIEDASRACQWDHQLHDPGTNNSKPTLDEEPLSQMKNLDISSVVSANLTLEAFPANISPRHINTSNNDSATESESEDEGLHFTHINTPRKVPSEEHGIRDSSQLIHNMPNDISSLSSSVPGIMDFDDMFSESSSYPSDFPMSLR
ncbi:hypothetical protein BDQ17DRAFT_1421976 [Cyathus striatus]|nr:hypothetical protein BDQ17DRAFT_1421976 [Cyathus striatus]